jgi:hypothetical protein
MQDLSEILKQREILPVDRQDDRKGTEWKKNEKRKEILHLRKMQDDKKGISEYCWIIFGGGNCRQRAVA